MLGMSIEALPLQNLEAAPFGQAKIRVEKCRRIRHDLKPQDDTPYSHQRVEELRDIETRSQQGKGDKKSGLEELIIDSRGYQERRFRMIYRSDQGEEVSEELIMFFKLGEDGQPQWLTLDGQPLALNGDLYDSRLESGIHASGRENRVSMVPRVGGRGEYTGVVSITETRRSAEKQEPRADQAQANTGRQDSITQTMQPVLDKIQNAGMKGRLGIEVQFTPEELVQVEQLLSSAHAKLVSSPELRQLENIIDQYRGDTAFGISLGFGTAILEDSSVNAPTVVQTVAGPKIKVPPNTFRLHRLQNQVQSAQSLLKMYQGKPLDSKSGNNAYGTSAGSFGKLIQAALEVYKT
ncbi:hypothetical protein A2690_00725 [Candidatus Roizmanbacteria bacterium RIFCSPHIGHO2_01_FULL_39_12b]|uniref:Uncharacterized protein n=1 Tax=Candidatus Roizmanbacteria bacterium RIFCSPHIGHO2_01_FULL_39_12b TaxID=1802030 RepID=A0A1F7GAN2_9BACT|nr:MAG: hypothetical protein A2690_00725 [Candidatus Roizmanbacteria bacterium RIFCSPHIGHO2_01_FULL_39_12b]